MGPPCQWLTSSTHSRLNKVLCRHVHTKKLTRGVEMWAHMLRQGHWCSKLGTCTISLACPKPWPCPLRAIESIGEWWRDKKRKGHMRGSRDTMPN